MNTKIDFKLENFINKTTSYKALYDEVRLVDPITKRIHVYENDEWLTMPGYCYDLFEEGHICKNCVSIRALNQNETTIKTQFIKDRLILATAIPIEFEGKKLVLELIKDVSSSKDILDDQLKEMRALIEKTDRLLVTDSLTQLYNRRYIDERLPSELSMISENKEEAYLLLFDLDDFKNINDQYGHLFGDKVLKEVANLLQNSFHEAEFVARYGGEEFLIYMKRPLFDVINSAESFRKQLGYYPFTRHDKLIYINTSGGIIKITNQTFDETIKEVDERLYEAKHDGKNKVIYHDK